jgi:hypothetical protein
MRARCAALALAACALPLHAADVDEHGDDGEGAVEFAFRGFALANYTARLGEARPAGAGDLIVADERLRLELSAEAAAIDLAARMQLDAEHDWIDDRVRLRLREAYIDYRAGHFDVRLGRQTLSWGVGDFVFINDVFPKDYGAFFAGRPIEYLKVPVDAVRTTITAPAFSLDLVVMPRFTSDGLPPPDRYSFAFDPFAGVARREVIEPRFSGSNTETAMRLYGSVLSTDVALYAFRGFFHAPTFAPDDPSSPAILTGTYPALSVYGASLQRNMLGGVLALEAGYHDSRDDRHSTNPLVPNSFTKALVGFQRELRTDFTVGIQYVGQWLHRDDNGLPNLPAELPRAERYTHTATLRMTKFLRHQTVRLSLFALRGMTERDLYVIPELEYKVSDRFSIVGGANLFSGRHSFTTFGVFRDNDNVYSWMRLTF